MTLSVRYMGSKRSLAPDIAQKITDRHPRAAVLDAFSGMCAVGSELAPRHVLLTNDVHAFAEVVAHALFVSASEPPTSLVAREELYANYLKNRAALRSVVEARLAKEFAALARVDDIGGWKKLLQFTEEEHRLEVPTDLIGLPDLANYRNKPKAFPYRLATSYFASGYFGIAQCLEIDSLRYAIDKGSPENRPYYLCALVQAMSQCAAAPGHFAQFLVPRDKVNTRYVGKIRSRSIIDRFYQALDRFPRITCRSRPKNRTFCMDATSLLENTDLGITPGNLVIYADPPYSKAQYSRYYHVLETVVLYDYPACTGKGRYRDSRFQTDFSRKAGVEEAFDKFVSAASKAGASLYLSYPTNGLLCQTGTTVQGLLSRHSPKSGDRGSFEAQPLDHGRSQRTCLDRGVRGGLLCQP